MKALAFGERPLTLKEKLKFRMLEKVLMKGISVYYEDNVEHIRLRDSTSRSEEFKEHQSDDEKS